MSRAQEREGILNTLLTLEQFQQVAYLSLMGVEPWRMYRGGLPLSMVLELHVLTKQTYAEKLQNACATLFALRERDGYRTFEEILAVTDAGIRALPPRDARELLEAPAVRHPMLAVALGAASEHDERVVFFGRLIAVMMDSLFWVPGKDIPWVGRSAAAIWFPLCDAAAGVDPANAPAWSI